MAFANPAVHIIAEGLGFPEGPVALADGSVLVVEIGGRALTRIMSNGRVERVAALEGGPNGAALGPEGWIYICNSGGWLHADVTVEDGRCFRRVIGQSSQPGWIERVRLSDGRVGRLYDHCGGQALQSPNDLVFDAAGGFYFTDHGKRTETSMGLGAVYYGHADGRPLVRVIGGLVTPNGIALSPDGNSLYVAETLPRRLLAYPLAGAGRVMLGPWPCPAGGRVLAALSGFNALDSMAVDAQGWINVCSLVNGGIWSVSPDGVAHTHFAIDDPYTTNLCFAAGGRKTVFVTLSGSGRLAAIDWHAAGCPLHFN